MKLPDIVGGENKGYVPLGPFFNFVKGEQTCSKRYSCKDKGATRKGKNINIIPHLYVYACLCTVGTGVYLIFKNMLVYRYDICTILSFFT